MRSSHARFALLAAILASPACHGDNTGGGGDPDGRDPEVDAGSIDSAPTDTPIEIDGGIDGTIDAPIDSPIDTPPPPLPRWGVSNPGETENMVTVGAKTYILSKATPSSPPTLRTIVDRQVTATQTLPGFGGRLATDGQSLYILLMFSNVVTIWGQDEGEPGATSIIVAKLDDALAPRWRSVDSFSVAYLIGFDVGGTGDAVYATARHSGSSYITDVRVLANTNGNADSQTLPNVGAVAMTDTGKLFIGGVLHAGQSLPGHTATADESYLIKKVNGSTSFTRYGSYNEGLVGEYAGDPMLGGTDANGRRYLSRHSGASGAEQWTMRYDAGLFATKQVASAGANALYMFGTFPDRIDFSPTLRLETGGDADIYLAEIDAATGVVRSAQQFGSASQDFITNVEPGLCPLLAGTLRGPLTHGQGVLNVPAGNGNAFGSTFVATACPAQ